MSLRRSKLRLYRGQRYFGCSFFRMRRTSMNVNDVDTEIKQPNIMSTMVSIYAVSLSVWLIAKTR